MYMFIEQVVCQSGIFKYVHKTVLRRAERNIYFYLKQKHLKFVTGRSSEKVIGENSNRQCRGRLKIVCNRDEKRTNRFNKTFE
jgi:hypothetical protein